MPQKTSEREIADVISSIKRTADLVQKIDHKIDNHSERIVKVETKLNMVCKNIDEDKKSHSDKFTALTNKVDTLSKEVWMQSGFWGAVSALIVLLGKTVITGS